MARARRTIVWSGVAITALAGCWWIAFRLPDTNSGDRSPSGIVVVDRRDTQRNATAATAVPPLPPTTTSPPLDGPIAARILAAIGTPGVEVHDVRIVDGARDIACGFRFDRERGASRRIVWMGQAGLVATDDGSADFATIARQCDVGGSA